MNFGNGMGPALVWPFRLEASNLKLSSINLLKEFHKS
jgi:hypothetical protein